MRMQRWLLRAIPALYGALALGATIVRADNCSDPSDCQAAPANIDWTTALGISGVLILVCWRLFSPRAGGAGRSRGAVAGPSTYGAKEGLQQGYAPDADAHAEHAPRFGTTGQTSAAFSTAPGVPADSPLAPSPGDYGAGHPGAAPEGLQAPQGYGSLTPDAPMHHQMHAPGAPLPHEAHTFGPSGDATGAARGAEAASAQGIGGPPGSPGDLPRAPLAAPEAAHEAMPLRPPEGIQAPIPTPYGRSNLPPEGRQAEEPRDRAHVTPGISGRPPGYEALHTADLPGPAHEAPGAVGPRGTAAHEVPDAIGAPAHEVPEAGQPRDLAAHDRSQIAGQWAAFPPPAAFAPIAAAPYTETVPFLQDVALVGAGAGVLSGVFFTPLDAAGQRLARPALLGSFTTDRFGLGGGAFPLALDPRTVRAVLLEYYLYPSMPPAPPAAPPFRSELIAALAPMNGHRGPARFAGFVVQEPTIEACQSGQPGIYTDTIAVTLLNGPPNTAHDFYLQPNTLGAPVGLTTATTNAAGHVTVFARTPETAPILSPTAPTAVTVTAVPSDRSPATPIFTLVASGANIITLTCASLDRGPSAITPLGITAH